MRNPILAALVCCVVWLGAPVVSLAQETAGPTPAPAAKAAPASAPDPAASSGPPPHIAYLDKEKTIYVMDFAPAPEQEAKPAAAGVSSSDGPIDSGSMGAPRLNASDPEPAAPAPAANSGPSRILADDLMRGLKKAGYKAKFLSAQEEIPEEGLLITGVFTEKGSDGVLRSVNVGSGQTAGDALLYLTSDNLLRTVRPLYEPVDKHAAPTSSGIPIRLNPEVATLKFPVPANLDARAMKKLADQIVAELQRLTLQAESQGLDGSGDPINKYSKP